MTDAPSLTTAIIHAKAMTAH